MQPATDAVLLNRLIDAHRNRRRIVFLVGAGEPERSGSRRAPLLNGGRLVLMPPDAPSIEDIGRELERRRITTLWLTQPMKSLFRRP